MTNNFITKTTILAMMIAVTVSCKKSFLEVIPKGKLIAQNTADYDLMLNSPGLINIETNAQVILGDDVAAAEPYFSSTQYRTQHLFRYEDEVYEDGDNIPEMSSTMQNIYIYNKIINEVLNSTEGTDEQKVSIQAEAKAGRAFTNFLLINYYGKPYNETTSASDPGFPILTEADVTATSFTRVSVKEIYDFMVKDLTEAIPHLPRLTYRMRMSRSAGEAMLAKVYMFMGKFQEAMPLLNAAFTDLNNSEVTVKLYDYNITLGAGGSFLPIGSYGPTLPAIATFDENMYTKQASNSFSFNSNELVLNPQLLQLFKSSDLRLTFFSKYPAPNGQAYLPGMLRRIGPISAPLGVVLPDLYLLRAECKARLNDLIGATQDVETLRKSRMPAGDAYLAATVSSQQLPLIKFILDERIREFAVQGYRWFDMRRLSVDPLFPAFNYTHDLYSATGAVTSYALRRERLVLRFPIKLMADNPGMINNP